MTSERSQAYGRVMRRLSEATGVKLHDAEAAILREAADTLLFAEVPHAPEAVESVMLVSRLMGDLAESGRWTAESAQTLADDVTGCGPALVTV